MASSGKITSKVTNNDYGAYWSFEWTAEPSDTKGQTIVSWEIWRRGRSSSPKILATNCDITVEYNGKSSSILSTGNIPFDASSTKGAFNNKWESSGNFTVQHDSDGSGYFSVTIKAHIDGDRWDDGTYIGGWDQLTNTGSASLNTNYPYTKCYAPTSVTASGLVAPNGEVTVSWSGASGGTSNSISGYDIYWRITPDGKAPTIDTKDGSKSIELDKTWESGTGKATINIGNAARGHTVVFGVVTKGEAGSSYYSGITTGGSVKINTRPLKPSAGTVSPTIIPASGGTITFNITPGTDLDGQTVGLRYATSATGTKTACASSFSLQATNAETYYFWSHDGLEDSDGYYQVSVQSNTKPTVTIQVSGTELETVNILTGAAYVLSPTITLTKGNTGQQKNNTYNYYIHYRTEDDKTWKRETLWENDTSLTKTIDDVRALGYFTDLATEGYYYYFSATRNDGLDTSEAVDTFSTKYYASKRPSLLGMYNTQDYQNINLSEFQGYFSKALSFSFQKDTGYNSLKIFSGTTQVGTISLAATQDDLRGQWLGINLTKGSYTFTGELGHAANNFYTTKLELGKSFKIENLEAKNLTASADFQVYTPNVIYDFSIYNTFNTTYDKLNEIYKEYGISDISSSFYARLTVDSATGKTQPLTIVQKTVNGNSTTNDTLYFSLTAAQLYDMLPNINDKNKTYKGTLTVGFKDVFENDTSTSIDYTINYGAIPQVSSLSIKVNNSKEANDWEYLKEGMPLTITGVVRSYNTKPKIQIQINRIKNGIESGYVDFGTPIDLASNSTISNTTPTQDTPTSYTFSNKRIITIGELTELDYQVNFRAKIITDAEAKYHYTGSKLYAENIKVCGHTSQGAVILSKADYSAAQAARATSKLKYTYINTHPGASIFNSNNYSLILNVKLQYRNITESDYSNEAIDLGLNSLSTFIEESGKDREIAFTFPEGMDAFVCRLIITTTQEVTNDSESYTTTKIVYTNEQAVYNVLPTVSYRKNLLGINATNLYDEGVKNAVLVIGEHSSKNIIYFLSSTGTKKVNTSTGDIDGFVIDGGEW